MTITEKIGANIRRVKAFDRAVRIADFQLRVSGDEVALVNLRTGAVQFIQVDDSDFDESGPSIIQ